MKPFYVRLTSIGPNNSTHKKRTVHSPSAYYSREGASTQVFKVVEIDPKTSSNGTWDTYITEDGYFLWSGCCAIITEEEYFKEEGILQLYEIY